MRKGDSDGEEKTDQLKPEIYNWLSIVRICTYVYFLIQAERV